MLPSATVGGTTRAYVGPSSRLDAGGITITATDHQTDATATTTAVSVGAIAGTGSNATATVSRTTEAFVGTGGYVDSGAGATTITASSPDTDAFAESKGGTGAAIVACR